MNTQSLLLLLLLLLLPAIFISETKKKRIIAQPVKDSKREAELTLSEQLARRSRVRVYYIKHKRP